MSRAVLTSICVKTESNENVLSPKKSGTSARKQMPCLPMSDAAADRQGKQSRCEESVGCRIFLKETEAHGASGNIIIFSAQA